MSDIKNQTVKIVDTDSTNIGLNIVQLGPVGVMPVEIVDDSGNQITSFPSGLSIPTHDDIVLSYTGDNLTGVVYKASGLVVATLTLTYTGNNLIRITKS